MKIKEALNKFIQIIWKRTLILRIGLAKLFIYQIPGLYSVIDGNCKVPEVQKAAYQLVVDKYLQPGDIVLDVGFGLGYGLNLMSKKAKTLIGIDIDRLAVAKGNQDLINNPKIQELKRYDGMNIPYEEKSIDIVTCIDVIEHVPNYSQLINNMCKVARRAVIISTPNRRSEFTKPNGKPMNPWHLREWSFVEFDEILEGLDVKYEWNLLNGNWDGPFEVSSKLTEKTMALTPAIKIT
jgi:2-polyprenyl-3-methyl-5-hydroxy-6-metoxy-1,4-benzoquinol methylase